MNDSKVYPLRQLLKYEVRGDSRIIVAHLECGHDMLFDRKPEREMYRCYECEPQIEFEV